MYVHYYSVDNVLVELIFIDLCITILLDSGNNILILNLIIIGDTKLNLFPFLFLEIYHTFSHLNAEP